MMSLFWGLTEEWSSDWSTPFGWGRGVEHDEGLFDLAERQLRKEGESERTHNLAVSGYSQLQHRHQIELARELGAGVVVVGFCLTNDVLENAGIVKRGLGDNNRRQDANAESQIADYEEEREPSCLHVQSSL